VPRPLASPLSFVWDSHLGPSRSWECVSNGHHVFLCSYSYYSCDGHCVLDVLAHGHHVFDVFTLGAFTMVFMFLMFLLLLVVFMMFLLLVCL
jgi:hypothetical protein